MGEYPSTSRRTDQELALARRNNAATYSKRRLPLDGHLQPEVKIILQSRCTTSTTSIRAASIHQGRLHHISVHIYAANAGTNQNFLSPIKMIEDGGVSGENKRTHKCDVSFLPKFGLGPQKPLPPEYWSLLSCGLPLPQREIVSTSSTRMSVKSQRLLFSIVLLTALTTDWFLWWWCTGVGWQCCGGGGGPVRCRFLW